MTNVKCLVLLKEQSQFEMEIGPWISMWKLGSGGKDLCAVQEGRCAQSHRIQVRVILGKSLDPYRLSSPLLR